jgi:hypothetical protein
MDVDAHIVDKTSPAEAKIALFRSLFRGREDVYAPVREPEDGPVGLCARLRERVGTRYLPEASDQMRRVSSQEIGMRVRFKGVVVTLGRFIRGLGGR